MRVLFDHGTPAPLRRELLGHEVATAYERGWSTLKNGELITTAEAGDCEVILTTDKNLRYQQNLTGRSLAGQSSYCGRQAGRRFLNQCIEYVRLWTKPRKAATPNWTPSDANRKFEWENNASHHCP